MLRGIHRPLWLLGRCHVVWINQEANEETFISAGIVGLTCALKLQDILVKANRNQCTHVLVVAREWPASLPGSPPRHSIDYASMWAGAHVRPILATTPQLRREAAWLKQTVAEFARQFKDEPSIGITPTEALDLMELRESNYEAHTEQTFASETGLPGFQILPPSETPEGVLTAVKYQTYCVNPPLYCSNLLRKFLLQGGKTLQRELRSEWEAFSERSDIEFVVNASGYGFGDPKCFPVRGEWLGRLQSLAGINSITPFRADSSNGPRNNPQNSYKTRKRWLLELHHTSILQWWYHHRWY